MPDGLASLDKSRSWAEIYDNGEARIYEWRAGLATTTRVNGSAHDVGRGVRDAADAGDHCAAELIALCNSCSNC